MSDIDTALDSLRKAYKRDDMTALMSSGMPALYPATTGYIGAIRAAFYDGGSVTTAPKDRERCQIALLASRDAGLNLALHIYIGLMEELSQQEVADVIFLAGVYTGVDRLSDGLAAYVRTLNVLAKTPARPNGWPVMQVVGALKTEFGPPPTPAPPAH